MEFSLIVRVVCALTMRNITVSSPTFPHPTDTDAAFVANCVREIC